MKRNQPQILRDRARRARKLTETLTQAFPWRETAQGLSYWLEIVDSLEDVARRFERQAYLLESADGGDV